MNPNDPSRPTEQPLTPVETQPLAPVAPLVSPTSDSNTTKSKKMILIASIVGGVVLLALIGTLLYISLMTVSKQDYRDAAVQFKTVSTAGSKLSSTVKAFSSASMSSSSNSNETTAKNAKDSVINIREKNAELRDFKAVRVGEGKELYTAFDSKLTAYLANADDIIISVEKVMPALTSCSSVNKATDRVAQLAAIKTCSTNLNSVKDIPNVEFKAFVDSVKDGYTKYIAIYESMSALTNPYGSQYEEYKTLRDESNAIQKSIQTASKTFTTDIEKRDNEVSVQASADALSAYLTEQQK